jgi:hypothetical protein
MAAALFAAIRPDEWNFALFLHVLGATVLVGGVATAATAQFLGWRRQETADALPLARLAFRALLLVAIPGWIVMRIGAQWIASKEGLDGTQVPTWVDVGYATAEPGGGLLLAATLLAWLGARRLRRTGSPGGWALSSSAVLVTVVLVAFLVAVWAMTAKPV